MSLKPPPPAHGASAARKAREQFVARAQQCLRPLGDSLRSRLMELASTPGGARDMQERRDALLDFDRKGAAFLQGTAQAWIKAIESPTATMRVRLEPSKLQLVDEAVVDRKILASRLALAIQEKATWELNDLKVRMQYLDGEPQANTDILRPEAMCQLLVEQWEAAGLTHEAWSLVQDVIQRTLAEHVPPCYAATNQFLIDRGVMRDIDLASRVRRGASGGAGPRGAASAPAADAPPESGVASDQGASMWADPASAGGGSWGAASGGQGGHSRSPSGFGGRAAQPGQRGATAGDAHSGAPGGYDTGPGMAYPHGGAQGPVGDETRMLTSSPPLARARQRASGVLGQLRRLLTDKVAGFDQSTGGAPSPALAEAMRQPMQLRDTVMLSQDARGGEIVVYDDAAVQQVAVDLRRQTGELKQKAATTSEKATIEIVALMFQSILAEERIPPAIRVWFARLQMPVLRVAISEPEFFGTLEHPARQLIDRMGSCVLGFDSAAINGSALEEEIRRVVQTIEQYPETGRRVFQLVYDEFQRFLARYLTETGTTQKVVSVAQQVEEKETLEIQYTIELRKMLADLPVRDEIREFLFKVWAEVLAVAAVRHGPQDEQTLSLKSAASELVWAASAKPNRQERAKVIQELPSLLHRLRQGMNLVNITGADQEKHIKSIGDTLADAFMSKTKAIPQERIHTMAQRLAHLEDFVPEDASADLPLDRESIEMMVGIDASMIEVVADGGSRPTAGVVAWAAELQVGNWFILDHNGTTTQVQYVWRSDRKQLHLFAAPAGRSYLIQARRLAAYLQAGLLVPAEEEALTVRATRDALAKLDANPERLLQ